MIASCDLQRAAAALREDGIGRGDVGYLDADGFLFIVDRAADRGLSRDVNLYAPEIETVLQVSPGT